MFRFEELEIWKESIKILDGLLDISDHLTENNLYRFAEQLRGAALSISNNIAEGAGCQSNPEFIKFLGYSRRSAFEVVNMLIIFHMRDYIIVSDKNEKLQELEELCRMVSGFIKTLSS